MRKYVQRKNISLTVCVKSDFKGEGRYEDKNSEVQCVKQPLNPKYS